MTAWFQILDYNVKDPQVICLIYRQCGDYSVDLNWKAISMKSIDNRQMAAATPSGRISVSL